MSVTGTLHTAALCVTDLVIIAVVGGEAVCALAPAQVADLARTVRSAEALHADILGRITAVTPAVAII